MLWEWNKSKGGALLQIVEIVMGERKVGNEKDEFQKLFQEYEKFSRPKVEKRNRKTPTKEARLGLR